MTRHVLRLAAICCTSLAALAAPIGCSGGGPSVDTTTYCGKAAVAVCANMMACCTAAQRQTTLGDENVNDEARCQHDLAVSCEIDIAETLWAVDNGTVKYDDAMATKCIDAIKHPEGECALVTEVAPHYEACKDSPFSGQVAANGDCHWTVECVKGATCTSGKCKAPPAEGETCSFTCAEGLYCKAGKCAKRLASGATCTSTSECETNLYCDTTCQPLKAVGNACTSDTYCESKDCGAGSCTDGTSCSSDLDCDGVCKKGGNTCWSDFGCDSYCATSGKSCYLDSECDTASGEKCLDDTCENSCNDRVCSAKPLITVDYCKLAN